LGALCLAGGLVALAGGCRGKQASERRVTVFAAASLDQVLADLSDHLRQTQGLDVEFEISGSQEAARKIAEYGRAADVLLVADYRVIDWIIGPEWAEWNIRYATNELVLGYTESSKFAGEITTDNWPEVILRPGVKVARADENLAPVGYQTLLCCQLASIKYADLLNGRDLQAALLERTTDDLVRPTVIGLVPLIGTRADYAFIYRSVAHGHNLPYIRLAPEVNFADAEQAEFYARARVELNDPQRTIQGAPILYGCTVPSNAPDAEAGAEFLAVLLGEEGREIMERNGFNPLARPECDHPERVPDRLRALCDSTGATPEP
jgi:molybdate/tungstate transport system substrate-binding protein